MLSDLREFVDSVEDTSELARMDGADWDLELGAITEVVAEREDGPALLFDDIVDYPSGFRVLTNPFGTVERTKLGLNMDPSLGPIEVIDTWRTESNDYDGVSPTEVDPAGVPVRENVHTGSAVDVTMIPAPKWHEHDGGRYIGTGCTVITKDPDTGWVNLGVYRSVVLDEESVSVLFLPGKDGRITMEKYHDRGESCPVAMVLGEDPHTWFASSMTVGRQESEYELAGWMRDEPVPVIESEYTGLPVPATAEIVLEGEVPPLSERSCSDGPFGEWPGYATPASENQPVLEIDAVTHRNDPILLGIPPLKPPGGYYEVPIRTAGGVWNQLENAGISGITGVWSHVFERPQFLAISIEQQYPGHAKQVATAATTVPNGVYGGRYTIVVEDDVDITDTEDVIWALCTRCDVEEIDVIRDLYTSPLDPVSDEGEAKSSRMVMNACRPYEERDSFPTVNRAGDELRERVREEWNLDEI